MSPPPGCPAHGSAVPLWGPQFLVEPAELYRGMRREHGAVVPVMLPGEVPAWLVIAYRELHQVTGDPELFSRDSELWNQWDDIPADWPLLPMIGRRQPSILYTVGEAHQHRHAMVSEALDGVDTIELRRHCERFADGLIDRFCGTGEADLIGDYAMLLPIMVLARLYGFPDAEGPGLAKALNDMIDGGADALKGQQHLVGSMQRLVAAKRARPGADVVSRMLTSEAGYSDEEILQDLMVMSAAGHQPTADWVGNSLRLMLVDDRFAASMSGGRHSIAEAMNEVLWEDTPTQNVAGRWASRDTQLGGRHVRRGDLVLLGLAGANADPQIHNDRSAHGGFTGGNSAFFSFGHGEHRCPFPAQEIAETIARTGIEVLLDRLPDIDLTVAATELTRRPSPWLRGMSALPVHFTPTPASGGVR
ncbi:cytochrome P450 [Streptomyces sp. 549]|uniref:cytochrome P450 n=1 Tax=Streptomyces sp. 549 TaxID=3049076 RepID=UPI0024C23D9A|nr:cytochrome P450 [Streptomyces sp. 549]MDK1476522.1 cytochrome P450 [Streptomyces sp. 549]